MRGSLSAKAGIQDEAVTDSLKCAERLLYIVAVA